MVRLWWPQPARPPPQRWRQAAEHREGLRRHSPTPHGAAVVAVPSSEHARKTSGGGSVVEKGKGVVGCDVACRCGRRQVAGK
ncbi:hypothetical protein Tco_1250448 [Tanacetum coccineum]